MQQMSTIPAIGDLQVRAWLLALINDCRNELTWQHARDLFTAAFDSDEQQSTAS